MKTAALPRSSDGLCVDLANRQFGAISRLQALELGLSDRGIGRRVAQGAWRRVHPGVYLVGAAPLDRWTTALSAATLAGGPRAVVSHRAASVLYGLDGLSRAPVEITVPHGEEANLRKVAVHRSRLLDDCDVAQFGGLPATRIERTLIDLARFESEETVEKALESAIRRKLTTDSACWTYAEERGGGLPGAGRLRRVLVARAPGAPAGSDGEVAFLRLLRRAGVPSPERQLPVHVGGRTYYLDFAWRDRRFAVEFDGYQFHGGRLAHAADLDRQNAIVSLGWSLRRYSPTRLARDPQGIVAEIISALIAAA